MLVQLSAYSRSTATALSKWPTITEALLTEASIQTLLLQKVRYLRLLQIKMYCTYRASGTRAVWL